MCLCLLSRLYGHSHLLTSQNPNPHFHMKLNQVVIHIATLAASCLILACKVQAQTIPLLEDHARPLQAVYLSELPEAITYYDQGFGDFIRESMTVEVKGISLNQIIFESLKASLHSLEIELERIEPAADIESERKRLSVEWKARTFEPNVAEEMNPILSLLGNTTPATALIVIGPGKTKSERFIEGMAVMTKIGMLGIEKNSFVFTMPRIEIYSIPRRVSCAQLNPFSTKRIKAIYSNWGKDMASGPPESVAIQMQSMISSELAEVIPKAISQRSDQIKKCLSP